VAEKLAIRWNAAPLEARQRQGQHGRVPGWPLWKLLLGVAGVGGLLYAMFRERKPKSMPLVLPNTIENFVQTMQIAVELSTPGFSREARELIIAHAAYESGWGKAKAYNEANNPFNLTTVSGPFVPGGDTEYAPDGTVKRITQKWAVFPNLVEGTKGYLAFIQRPRYTDAYNRLINGDLGFLESLYRGGYFTLPLPTYMQNFQSVLARVQRTLQGG
jgi:flagellum-specific peptidoglycan hydrolase FlgJ